MNKFAIPALAAVIALGACAEAEAPEAEGETVVVEEPAATETVVVDEAGEAEGSSVSINADGVDATVSEDGVKADIKID